MNAKKPLGASTSFAPFARCQVPVTWLSIVAPKAIEGDTIAANTAAKKAGRLKVRHSSFLESRVARKLWFCGDSPCSAASRERLTPVFNYRFVGFGTTFEHRDGIRPVAGGDVPPFALYENEIAVDVGGRCFGCEGYDLPVLDHHALPAARLELCATAAVLHHATALQRRFAGLSQDRVVWLVTHRDGDFDAFASMYLVRWLLSGAEIGNGWDAAMERIDWYDPALGEIAPGIRWAVALASYAARIDNAKRISRFARARVAFGALRRPRAQAAVPRRIQRRLRTLR